MNPTLIAHLRTLLADPDRLDHNALFAILADTHATTILGCLAPPGSLAQIAAALQRGWSWDCDGWERHTNELMGLITDPRCLVYEQMIATWSHIPNTVGVLRDRTATLVAWAQQRLAPERYANLAILLGPSNASARLLVRYPFLSDMSTTLRCWSMGGGSDDPTMWHAMVDAALRKPLRREATPSWAFPAWGWDNEVDSDDVLRQILNDLLDGWSPDHPSIRGRIAWLERHVDADLDNVGHLASLASIAGSDALAETVCASLGHDPLSMYRIAHNIPWDRLHPRIQTVIDTTMRRSSDDRWKRTWAFAIGQAPVVDDATIDALLLLWRIDRGRWDDLDPSIRAALVSSINHPPHCYGWGVHPDLVTGKDCPYGDVFRFWNPDVPADDLRAWAYADLLREQRNHQDARVLIAFLDGLPPDRRMRFEPIIDGCFGGRPEPTPQPPWDWSGWSALPVDDRTTRLRDQLAVLWNDRDPSPAVRCWRARKDGLATLALMVGEVLGLDDPVPILAALLAQIPALRGDTTDVGSSLPFPDDLDASRRAQIERLPIDRDAQAYAAWCLRFLDQDMVMGSTLIALHPDVAVALAPFLSPAQQKAVAASPAAQGWESMTFLSWAAACAHAQEQPMPPRQRMNR